MNRTIKILGFCLIVMMLLSACTKEDDGPSATCLCDVIFAGTVSNKLATVKYNKKLQKWYLLRPERQQYEFFHEYYPQNMDKTFQKEGLGVRFSGDAYYMSIEGDATTTDEDDGEIVNRACLDLLTISETTSLEPLEGEWRLVGWQYQGNWWQVDPYIVGPYKFSLKVIPDYDYMVASSLDHQSASFMKTTLVDDKILFDTCFHEKGLSIIEDAQFFDKHIEDIKSYQRDGSQLKLYFGGSDYFLYTNDFDDNKPFSDDRWFDGPDYPYVAELIEIDNGKGEVTMKIIDVPMYPTSGTYPSVYLRHPGAQSICHFKLSDWEEKNMKAGDRLFCNITRFQQTDDNEPNRTYSCEVKPYKNQTLVENGTGSIRYEDHLGWYIQTDYPKTRYYPMKCFAEEFQKEGLNVVFSGYRYNTKEKSDYYFIDLTSIKTH